MIYQSIGELLSSTSYMTAIRGNTKNDSGTDIVNGVDWFRFKGVTAAKIYVSGDGWMNFGTNAEGGLKVNRRDQASWYVWREEGSIRNTENKFLRIRWRGYSVYSSTSTDCLLEFDVVLCSTGDIALKIVSWPTWYADGQNRLEAASAVPFAPGQAGDAFMFLHQDDGGYSYTLRQGIEEVFAPHYLIEYDPHGGFGAVETQQVYCGDTVTLKRSTCYRQGFTFIGWDTDESGAAVIYQDGQSITDLAEEGDTITLYAVWRKAFAWLLGDANGRYYTATRDDATQTRIALEGISELTARVFYEHGFQFVPDSAILVDLDSPRIYRWNEAESPELTAEVAALPLVPQPVTFAIIEMDSAVKYINISGDSESFWNVSFDGGETWYKRGNGWEQVTEAGDGCLKRRLEILSAADWAAVIVNGTLKFRCWLTTGGWIKRIRVDY